MCFEKAKLVVYCVFRASIQMQNTCMHNKYSVFLLSAKLLFPLLLHSLILCPCSLQLLYFLGCVYCIIFSPPFFPFFVRPKLLSFFFSLAICLTVQDILFITFVNETNTSQLQLNISSFFHNAFYVITKKIGLNVCVCVCLFNVTLIKRQFY